MRIGFGWLTVALVELAPPRAGDVRIEAVKDLTPLFVEIQALVHELTQVATALRTTVGVREIDGAFEGCVVAQPGDSVPHSEQSGAHHRTDARGVRHFIPAARLKTAVEPHVRV